MGRLPQPSSGGQPSEALLAHGAFVAYRVKWEKTTEIKTLKTRVSFLALAADARAAELARRFHAWAVVLEKDKLLHFVLADTQSPDSSPRRCSSSAARAEGDHDNRGKRREEIPRLRWSGAKGDEGIKLVKDVDDKHLTPLYDPRTRDNPAKLNTLIAQNFAGTLAPSPPIWPNTPR